MKEDFGIFLDIRLAERPGHDAKWDFLMADIKVDLTGLKASTWKYWASSRLVVSRRIMTLAWFV